MFRYFENLVDPFTRYEASDAPPKKIFPFLRMYLKPFYGVFILAVLLSALVAASELGLIMVISWLVDTLQSDADFSLSSYKNELLWLVAFVLLLRPIVFGLDVLILNNTLMTNVATLARWRAHRHVLRQSIGWFESDFAGRIANRVMQTPGAIGEVVFHTFEALAYASFYWIGSFIILGIGEPQLIWPLAIWMISYIAFTIWVVRRIGPASEAASDARSDLNGEVVDAYTNIHSVKMFATEQSELASAKQAIAQTRQTVACEMRIYTIMDIGLVTVNGFLMVAMIGWALYLWTLGQASTGLVAAAAALVMRLSAMSGWIMWALTSFFRELGVIREGLRTISEPIGLVDTPNATPLKIASGAISFQDVSHHYGKTSGGLQHLSLNVAPGEKVGLVGRSGAGKSTLFKLLLRFYDLESGSIRIDAQDIQKVTQDSLRAQIGMVQQESSLLHRSIRENIAYGMPSATEDDIIRAAKQADAYEFITALSDKDGNTGFDVKVGERGVKLSGGQRQRIALARIMLKDAPILLLDEATSALDSESEAAIQKTLYTLMEGKTVIAIAHRLSTIASMDRIIVLEDGQIAEEGTHDVLLKKNGLYAGFWARQSGGFLDMKADT